MKGPILAEATVDGGRPQPPPQSFRALRWIPNDAWRFSMMPIDFLPLPGSVSAAGNFGNSWR